MVSSSKIKFAQKVFVTFCVLTALISSSFSAACIEIDGTYNCDEWEGSIIYVLLDGKSNCGVDYGIIEHYIDNENNSMNLCFKFTDPSLEKDNSYVGLELTVEDSDSYIITASDTPKYADYNNYSFNGAMSIDKNNGATCEINIGFKLGLPKEISGNVRFIDADGALSNIYSFTIINEEYVEPTAAVLTEKNNDNKKSDKVKATSAKSENKRTTKNSKAETTREKETTQFYIQTSPPYSYVRKTRPHVTKRIETTAEKSLKTTKKPSAKVYYYEKEVIISQVYITEAEADVEQITSTTNISSENVFPVSEIKATEFIEQNLSSFANSEGTKYKVLIISVSAFAFGAIAAVSARSKKSFNKNNDSESQ